jgi:hypothetical protein
MKKFTKGEKPFKIQWTLKDSEVAVSQGWELFDAGGRFEIEVVTENPEGFGEGADDDAVAWVIQKACEGDKVCAKGLVLAGLLDPQWFASDLTHAVKTGHITVLDTLKKASKPYSTVEYRNEAPLNDTWENDKIQFARLIGEMCSLDCIPKGKKLKELCEIMDLSKLKAKLP